MTAEPRALQEIIDADDQPVFALDRDLCYTAFNRAHATMMRELYGAEIALGGRLTDYQTVAADRETAFANLERALAGEPVVASAYSGEPGRERRYFDVRHTPLRDDDGAVNGVVMHAVDVTERRRAENGLRESERNLATLMDTVPDIVFQIDRDYRLVVANAPFTRATISADRKPISPGDAVLAPEYPEEFRTLWRSYYDRAFAGESFMVETSIAMEDSTHCMENYLSPVRELDGEATSVVVTSRDITERRRAEDEIQRLNTDLERRVSERTRELTAANADLEDFVYSIAHDLRSPLRALSGFSELVQTDCGDVIDDTGRDYLRRIHDAAQHLGELMDALLSLSKVSRRDLDLRDVDLSALARGVAKQLRDAGPERAAAFEIEDGLVAHGDPALCEIVVRNLLGNAWKFSAGESPARISFGAQRVDGRRVYCVRDNGVGFDPQYSGKLFTPFERLHTAEEFPGTGIGLATVRRAVTRLGGRCWADSEPGCGAQAYFTLGEPC